MTRHLFLVGNMASGKSTLGQVLAQRLNRPFYDTDAHIERQFGKPIAEIFAQHGEAVFRQAETEALREIAQQSVPSVVATGGGMVLNPEHRRLMRRHGWVIYLKASPEVLLSRIQDPSTRPLLSDAPTPHEALQQITQTREPLYQESDWVLETEGRTIDSLVEELSLLANPSAETPLRVPVLA
ncbi:MAG: shikimate kinase, partial [Fimbriimonadales bacterium]